MGWRFADGFRLCFSTAFWALIGGGALKSLGAGGATGPGTVARGRRWGCPFKPLPLKPLPTEALPIKAFANGSPCPLKLLPGEALAHLWSLPTGASSHGLRNSTVAVGRFPFWGRFTTLILKPISRLEYQGTPPLTSAGGRPGGLDSDPP